MTYWNDGLHSEEEIHCWIGTCLSVAVRIGLNYEPNSFKLTSTKQKTWKRTWWALHNHLRLATKDLSSKMLIQEGCTDKILFDMPMITIDDFQFGVLAPEARALVDDCDVAHTVESQKIQAHLFIEKTKLCQLSLFSRIADRVTMLARGTNEQEPASCRQKNGINDDTTEELRRWSMELPAAIRYQYPSRLVQNEWDRSTYLHRAWLRLLNLGSLYAVFSDQFQTANETFSSPSTWIQSVQADRLLSDITDLFDEVDSLGLLEFLPSSATPLLVLALTYHQRPLSATSSFDQNNRTRSLQKCWNMIHRLEETSRLAGHTLAALKDSVWEEMWDHFASRLLPHDTYLTSGGTK